MLKSWTRDSALTVKKNPDYWDKPYPYLDSIDFGFLACRELVPDLDELAVVEHVQPCRDVLHQVDVVFDQQDRRAVLALGLEQDPCHLLGLGPIETGRGFVEEQQHGIDDQPAPDRDEPLLAARELAGLSVQ